MIRDEFQKMIRDEQIMQVEPVVKEEIPRETGLESVSSMIVTLILNELIREI